MAQAPSRSTPLNIANAKIAEQQKKIEAQESTIRVANTKIADLLRTIGAQESTLAHLRTSLEYQDRQVEELHVFLDALPDSIERQHVETHAARRPLVRLAAWFAARHA